MALDWEVKQEKKPLEIPSERPNSLGKLTLGMLNARRKAWKAKSKIVRTSEILTRIGPMSYKLDLLCELSNVHYTLSVSIMKPYLSVRTLVSPLVEILAFVLEP